MHRAYTPGIALARALNSSNRSHTCTAMAEVVYLVILGHRTQSEIIHTIDSLVR
jgi:hypothetical protein